MNIPGFRDLNKIEKNEIIEEISEYAKNLIEEAHERRKLEDKNE